MTHLFVSFDSLYYKKNSLPVFLFFFSNRTLQIKCEQTLTGCNTFRLYFSMRYIIIVIRYEDFREL